MLVLGECEDDKLFIGIGCCEQRLWSSFFYTLNVGHSASGIESDGRLTALQAKSKFIDFCVSFFNLFIHSPDYEFKNEKIEKYFKTQQIRHQIKSSIFKVT